MTMYVKLFKDGDHMGVETNADSEEVFRSLFAQRISDLIDSGRFRGDWEFQLGYWLESFSDICCKLRGHRSGAEARSVLRAGWVNAPDDSEVKDDP